MRRGGRRELGEKGEKGKGVRKERGGDGRM